MSKGLVFWVLMLLWMLSWAGRRFAPNQYPWAIDASDFLFFVLLFLLGWHAFGFIIY